MNVEEIDVQVPVVGLAWTLFEDEKNRRQIVRWKSARNQQKRKEKTLLRLWLDVDRRLKLGY